MSNAATDKTQPDAQEKTTLIATPTIARIYAQQGKLSQAREIYQHLLAAQPDRAQEGALAVELAAELEHVEARLAERAGEPPPELDSLGVEVLRDASGGVTLRCRWHLSDDALTRARLVLGGDGALTLRLAGFPADPDVATRDTSLEDQTGAVLTAPPPGSSLVTAAVGLLDEDGNFASISHCDMLQL